MLGTHVEACCDVTSILKGGINIMHYSLPFMKDF